MFDKIVFIAVAGLEYSLFDTIVRKAGVGLWYSLLVIIYVGLLRVLTRRASILVSVFVLGEFFLINSYSQPETKEGIYIFTAVSLFIILTYMVGRRIFAKRTHETSKKISKSEINPADANQNDDFIRAAIFFPELSTINIELTKIDPSLSITFKNKILSEQNFDCAAQISEELISKKLLQLCGDNPKLQSFYRMLALSGDKVALNSLREYLRVLKDTVSEDRIIQRVCDEQSALKRKQSVKFMSWVRPLYQSSLRDETTRGENMIKSVDAGVIWGAALWMVLIFILALLSGSEDAAAKIEEPLRNLLLIFAITASPVIAFIMITSSVITYLRKPLRKKRN